MSGIPQTRKLWITPLSPVHMGTDEDYTPTGYVIEGDALYEFDQRALENLPAGERSRLNAILNGKATPDMLRQVQAFFHHNREWLIPAAVNVAKVSSEMAKLYEARIGRAANVESGGKQVLNALEIERAFYNPVDRRLMLPGSGLKGAIRTALLDQVNKNTPLREMRFFDKRENRIRPPKNNREMQESIFKGSFATDPLRLVQIGDCAWHGPETLNSAEVLFAVNRKKQPVKNNGREVSSRAEKANLYQLLECAAPFRLRAFRGTLNISDLAGINEAQGTLPKHRFGFKDIAAACNRFYHPIFERENQMLKKRGFLDKGWRETVETLLDDADIQKRLENNEAFLLRVGRHSGAESVTLNGVRSIRIMKGKGQNPSWEPEAKTIWLASGDLQDKRHLRPFGWLLVEMSEPEETPPSWPAAEQLAKRFHNEMQSWLAGVRSSQQQMEKKVRAERERAQQQAREAAVEATAENERARRLASMSEEERLIEAVRNLLERDRQTNRRQAGGELNQKRLELLEAALTWADPSLRGQAADLLADTARWLPWARKRKQEIGEKLGKLREEG